MKKQKSPILSFLGNLDMTIACIACMILVALTLVGIVFRYVLGSPFAWMEEITGWCFLWMNLLGACVAFRTKSHVAVEIVVELFPKSVQRIIEVFIALLTGALLVYMTYQAVIYLGTVAGANRMTGLLRLPYAMIYGLLPVATTLMFVNMVYAFIKDLHTWKHPEEKEAENE